MLIYPGQAPPAGQPFIYSSPATPTVCLPTMVTLVDYLSVTAIRSHLTAGSVPTHQRNATIRTHTSQAAATAYQSSVVIGTCGLGG